jgi:streptogrisin C
VQAVGETVNYGNGDIVRGLTKTSVCAEAGDSGGPFMSGNQAQGTLSGGSGGCLLGGESYYQPIQEMLTTYGLTLVTGRQVPDQR